MATKQQKLARLSGGPDPQRPIPQVPKLPKCFYERHPEDAAMLDAYREEWIRFFKEGAQIQVQ